MAALVRSARTLKKASNSISVPAYLLSRQQAAAEAQACKQGGHPRLFSTASPGGSNPVHELGTKGTAGMPTWGYVAVGAGAGGIYYLYKNRQRVDAESASSGGDRYSDPHPTVTSDAVVPVDPPVPICPFQGEDPVQGTPLSLDDLLGDFAVVVTVDAKDPEVAQQVLDRLLQVIEGIDQKTNMQYTTPVVVEQSGDEKGKTKESGGKLKQLINEFMEKIKSKSNKTEARFKGLAGEEATKSIKEAIAESVRDSATGRPASGQSSSAAGSAKAGSPEEEPPILAAFGKGNMHLVTPEGTIVVTYEEAAVPEDVAESVAEQILDYKRSHPGWHGPKAVKARTA
ncbi:hypothetical protein WJX75_008827 [Coccomyxa subellipsoidea]|uniref:Uncharacterized protein n=1 Tax=Coccomyxa subellipsoidea TaxID=248742 RepID=A0ABR2YIF0_9CHLO